MILRLGDESVEWRFLITNRMNFTNYTNNSIESFVTAVMNVLFRLLDIAIDVGEHGWHG